MKKNSIIFKIFITIALIFSLFVIIEIGFQTLYLGKYYENIKIKNIENKLDSFISDYIKEKDGKKRTKLFSDFINDNKVPVVVSSQNDYYDSIDEYNFYAPYFMRFQTEDGEIHKISLWEDIFSEINNEYTIEDLNGKKATLNLIKDNFSDEYNLLSVALDGSSFKSYDYDTTRNIDMENDSYDSSIKKLKGKILFVEENYFTVDITDKLNVLYDVIYSESNYSIDRKGNLIFDYKDKESQKNYKIIVKEYEKNTGDIIEFYTLASLQPINEVVNILIKTSLYFVLIAILLVVGLSLIISRMITNPLIKLNLTAKKMAKLDFRERYKDIRNDEIGELGDTLNFMSDELSFNINELKVTNKKLLSDIEFKNEQEEIRKEFVSNVSHELKTPLGVIKSFAEGIKDGISKEKEDYYLEVIIDEISKMNTLIINMLELTNLETKNNELNLEKLNLEELINRILLKFTEIKNSKNIELIVKINEAYIVADYRKIENVLLNFISNCFRYTSKDGKIIIVIDQNRKNGKVIFSIENTTSNFSDEELEKIWDRFYRIEKSRSKSLGGSGLGLSIAKTILEKHNFKYGVKNTEIGVIFYIEF
ncbi:sensor histidine kinase [Helicovermis profundi]|uniref:histidine kinase n=1 Tax=Helicovermis profundi TaxID=3065157 RepID=A0AAU9E1K8_9FIRM|nr:HAMP domain-containing sensor histidine kinase [Clostridia bacterium S502]